MTTDREASGSVPDEDRFHDVVAGRRIVKFLNVREITLGNRLSYRLMEFDRAGPSGRVFLGLGFDLGLGDGTRRMPEVSFVSFDRWPRDRRLPSGDSWEITPDLVAEIVTPACPPARVRGKVDDYRRSGVRLIWQIVAEGGRVVVNRHDSSVEVLSEGDTLDGGDVLPGFRLPLALLFEGGFGLA